MDSAVQHCGGPKGTVNGRLLDAQKQIRMHPLACVSIFGSARLFKL